MGRGGVGGGSWMRRGWGWTQPLLLLCGLPQHLPRCWLGHNRQQVRQKGQVEGSGLCESIPYVKYFDHEKSVMADF